MVLNGPNRCAAENDSNMGQNDGGRLRIRLLIHDYFYNKVGYFSMKN